MGRFLSKLWNGAKKVGRFIGKAAGKVANVAGVLSNVPVIGGFASTVARGANLVSKVSNGVSNFMDKVDQKRQQYQPAIDKVKEAGKAVYNSGIPDKLTRGGFTRVINKFKHHRDRAERRFDNVAGHAQRIGQRIEAGVNKAGGIAQQIAKPG